MVVQQFLLSSLCSNDANTTITYQKVSRIYKRIITNFIIICYSLNWFKIFFLFFIYFLLLQKKDLWNPIYDLVQAAAEKLILLYNYNNVILRLKYSYECYVVVLMWFGERVLVSVYSPGFLQAFFLRKGRRVLQEIPGSWFLAFNSIWKLYIWIASFHFIKRRREQWKLFNNHMVHVFGALLQIKFTFYNEWVSHFNYS